MNTSSKIKIIISGLVFIIAISLFYSEKITPSSVELYVIKRTQEKLFMLIRTNPVDKLNYNLSLLNIRLNELSSLAENRDYDYLYSSSLRYSTTAGMITQSIISGTTVDPISPVKNIFRSHQSKILKLYNSCPIKEDDRCKYILDAYNYLEIYLSQLANSKWQ